jgi:hypothetical protein
VLSTEGFKGFAKDHVLFLHVTSHLDGAAYPNLLQEKGGKGFPYVVAMDAEGNVVGQLQDRNVEGFAAMMKDAADYARLLPKKDRTPAEELRFLRLEWQNEKVDNAGARTRATALKGLEGEAKADYDDLILSLDVEDAFKPVQDSRGRDPALRIAAGKAFAGMWKEGRFPGKSYRQLFLFMIFDYAEDAKDAALFEKALAKLKECNPEVPPTSKMFTQQEERLKKLQEAAAPPPPATPK